MTLEELETWHKGLDEQFSVPEEERQGAIKSLEVGQYPADQPIDFLKAGRTKFEQLKTERQPLVDQVKKARVQEQEFRDKESVTGRIKEFGKNLLAPSNPSVVVNNTPEIVNNPVEKSLQPAPESRFKVDEGEIIDTKRGMIVTPDQFNQSANPQEKQEIEHQLRSGGLLDDTQQAIDEQVKPTPTPQKPPGITPESIQASPDLFARGISQKMATAQPGNPLTRYQPMEPPKPLSLGDAFQESGKVVLRGMGQTGASALKGVGMMAYELDQTMKSPEMADKQLGDYATVKLGTKISDMTERMFPGRKDLQDNFLLNTVPQALGSSLVFLGAGAAGAAAGAGMAATAGTAGALVGASSLYEKGKDATPEQKRLGLVIGAALGSTEALPIAHLFKQLNTATGGTLSNALKIGTVQAIEEALQEGFQQIGENLTVKHIYGQAQSMLDGVKEGMGAGGLLGFLTGAILARKGRYGSTLEKNQPISGVPASSSTTPEAVTTPAGPKASGPMLSGPFSPPPKQPTVKPPPVDLSGIPGQLNVQPAGAQRLIKKPMAAGPVPNTMQMPVPAPAPTTPEAIPQTAQPGLSAEAQAAARPAPPGYTTIEGPMPTFADGSPIQVPYRQPIDVTPPKQPLPPASVPEMAQPLQQPVSQAVTPEDMVPGAAPLSMAEQRTADLAAAGHDVSNVTHTPATEPVREEAPAGLTQEQHAQQPDDATVQEIHHLADQRGMKWDNDPAFMDLTERVTGKRHLDQLSQAQLNDLSDILYDQGPSQPVAKQEVPAPVTPTDIAAHQAATSPTNPLTEPTKPQQEAGNYQKGHVSIAGLDVSIENPAGSTRSGTDKGGKPWSQIMRDHYGYIRGTIGKDKDHLDVFIKPGTPQDYSGPVFVVDQKHPGTKTFDEHKIVMGAKDSREASKLYEQNYAPGWKGMGSLSTFTMPQFKEWLKSGDHTKPAVDYKIPAETKAPSTSVYPGEGRRPTVIVNTGPVSALETPEAPAPKTTKPSTTPGQIEKPKAKIVTPQLPHGVTTPEAIAAPKQTEKDKAAASIKLADDVKDILSAGNSVGTELFDRANTYFGGTQAQGAYTPKDAYDALELGINKYMQEKGGIGISPAATVEGVKEQVQWIRKHIMDRIPTQTRRTDEQNEFQQFSTPPDLALVMTWAANVHGSPMTSAEGARQRDVVLEPSAGVGGIAGFALNEGAKVYVNELSPRRAALLKSLGFNGVFTENAEQINNILPKDIKPTVVLMNPPFSSTAGRMAGERKTANVLTHLDQALKRLEPGGRLVALIGKGKLYADPKVLEDWIAETASKYAYRARIGISGKNYKKYGTTFDNQILIYDKIAPDGFTPVKADVEDVLDAIPLLKEVRDARQFNRNAANERPSTEPARQAVSDAGTPIARPGRPVSPATRPVGTRQPKGVTPESSVAGDRPTVARQPADVEAGGRPDVSQPESGRPAQPTVKPTTAQASDVGKTSRTTGAERAGSPDERGSKPGLPAQQVSEALTVDTKDRPAKSSGELTDSVYESYTPRKVKIAGAQPHPGKLVESAALSAVDPPDATYRPHLDKKDVTQGLVSDTQLEAIVYAGEAHQHLLPSGERKGFFLGDGPGVGKGRTLAAIIKDNWNQGRKKAVWISETQNLVNAAVRDWKALEGKESDLFGLSKFTRDQPLSRNDGILYTTYTTMASGLEAISGGGLKAKQAKGQPLGTTVKTRLDQVLNWLGPDFDGVLIFDEAHNMQNSLEREGERGDVLPAAKALASVTLQARLPKARIVYASATAATRIDAMGYAERLGLWGEGTPFANKTDFIGSIESSGLGAMEIVAQNMKSMGGYISRNLDYSEVKYRKLEHPLTPAQRETYDAMAKGWQVVLRNLDAALEMSGVTGTGRGGEKKTLNSRAKSAAYGKFWGANQRFFNQILTSMQLPSVVSDMKAQLEAGHSILVQLVNTNEAIMTRQLQAAEQSGEELDTLDMTPRQNLMQYIEHAFPTAQFEEYIDDNGNKRSQMVMDAQGRPVQNAEAVAMKEAMKEQLGSMRVPEGPLEILLNTFGTKMVAEVTGRSERIVRQTVDDEETISREKRTPATVREDVESFMGGKKRILVFSDKGGTGESYHADRTKKNQQKRIHYLLQPGWRADKAVQGLGRSNRTNQASAPEYVLTMTDIKGHKRFISTIARRLDQLGALTKGQRQAGSSGLIEAKDNLENKYAAGAVKHFFMDMFRGNGGDFNFKEVTSKLGLNNLVDKDGSLVEERLPSVPQFLNRMLSVDLKDQNALFDEFYKRMERAVDIATQAGDLDTGMETYRADGGIRLLEESELYRDPQTKATVMLGKYEAKHSVSLYPSEVIEKRSGFQRYLKNNKSGKVWAMLDTGTRTKESGEVVTVAHLQSPAVGRSHYVELDSLAGHYTPLTKPEGRGAWEEQMTQEPSHSTEHFYLATGNILKIWDRFPSNTMARIRRIQTTDGKRALGRMLPEAAVENLKVKLGKGERTAPTLDAGEAFDAVLDEGSTLKLANDWQIKRARVNQEPRLEIVGEGLYHAKDQLKGYGAFTENIQYATRYFIPTEKTLGEKVIAQIIKHRPIIDVIRKGADILKSERGSIPVSPLKLPAFTKEAREYKALRAKQDLIGFSSSDEDIEARVREAKRGLKPEGIWSRLKEHGESVWHLVSREFEHLPDTALFSPLRTDLLRLAKYKGIAADQVQRDLAAIIKPLSRKQYDQFEWKALLADLSREAQQDRPLPFGYTKDKVQEDLDRLDEVIAHDPMVQKAWAKRQSLWETKKAEYQRAMDAIGFDTSKKLTKEDYFRHQVLEHARERHLKGTGAKVRTPTGRGFLKARHGSTMDINANYVQAEFEVMTQMVYDTQLAKVIQHVDRDLNIRPALQAEAKALNADALQAKIDEGGVSGAIIEATMKDFRNRIGMHMGMARKKLDLPKGERLTLEQLAEIADDPESPANLSARGVFKAISERKAYVKDLLAKDFKTWDQLVPDTHALWQPREGNVFYMADSIPAQLAKALQEGMMTEAGLNVEQLRKVLAQGGKREEYVIPVEAKATLDDLSQKPKNWFVEANRALISHWKQLMLVAPRKVIRYNVRNLTGDADAMFVGNPHAFTKVQQSAADLIPVIFKDTVLSGEAKEWAERGGYGTTLQWQELGDVNDIKAFKASLDRESKGGMLSIPAKVWNGYWKSARLSTDYREAIMRYAAYLDYLQQMQQASNGRPKNFGASIPATVMALPDLRDRAFKMSNELLGAYDRVSVAGQTTRAFWIPFWSWQEVNATRYQRLIRNAILEKDGGAFGRMAGVGAKKAVLGSARAGTRAGIFLIKLSMFWSTLQAWNMLMYGDDEDELRETNPTVANRPHVLCGRGEDGKICYLAGIGALGDLLAWFGLDAAPSLVGDVMHDRMTIGEAFQNVWHAPVNKLISGLTPTLKMPIEMLVRQNFYPDPFHPRPIQDRADYLGQQTTFGPEIQKLRGKPGKPLYGGEDVSGLLVQRTDPKAGAYGTWQGIERKYLERMGKDSGAVFWRSPKGEALSNWSRALKDEDTSAELHWKGEYERLEREKYGQRFSQSKMMSDLEKSLRSRAPLAGVTKVEREAIVSQLDAQEKRTLAKAEDYYEEVILQVLPESRRQTFTSKLRRQHWLSPSTAPHELTP